MTIVCRIEKAASLEDEIASSWLSTRNVLQETAHGTLMEETLWDCRPAVLKATFLQATGEE